MSFMESYKDLDNLCKTFSEYPRGISSYIEEMDKCCQYKYKCYGWDTYYASLKKYRYIRNQIAHESGVYEDRECSLEDERWIKNFYNKILNQSDPIAIYYKTKRCSEYNTKQINQHKAETNIEPQNEHRSICQKIKDFFGKLFK